VLLCVQIGWVVLLCVPVLRPLFVVGPGGLRISVFACHALGYGACVGGSKTLKHDILRVFTMSIIKKFKVIIV
jgi:hypothetical protein